MFANGCSEFDNYFDKLQPTVEQPNDDTVNGIFNTDSKGTYIIDIEGGEVIVTVTTNMEYNVNIPSSAKSWLNIADTRTNVCEEKLKFTIAKNDTFAERKADIELVDDSGKILQTIKFQQKCQLKVFETDNKGDYIVVAEGGVVEVAVTTNLVYDVVIPNSAESWLVILDTRTEVRNETLIFVVSENNTVDERSVEVQLVDENGKTLQIIRFVQKGLPILFETDAEQEYNIDGIGGIIEIAVTTNAEYKVSIPADAQSWISVAVTRVEAREETLTFVVAKNNSIEERSADIHLIANDNEVLKTINITQQPCEYYTIYYTNGSTTNPTYIKNCFGANIISNKYDAGKKCWVIAFDSEPTEVGDSAFYGCRDLITITIPDSVTTIGDYAFYNCSSLTSVTIPDSVTTIGDYAFWDCSSLTSVTIPDSVISIGREAFYGCTGELIIYSKIVETSYSYDNYPYRCGWLKDSEFTKLTIGNNITKIGECAFFDSGSLTSVTIGDSVTTIGDCAFDICKGLTSVTIGDSVTTIGKEAFGSCNLINVTIPDSVTTIGHSAFWGCYSLTSVTIGNGVTTIGDSAFYGCDSLISVTIPDNVTTIGQEAFSWCRDLKSVIIGNGVTITGRGAFSNCKNLTSVTICNGVTAIGDGAFSDCESLTSVTIPDSVTTIGEFVFYHCHSLTSITIPDSVTTIGEGAFYDCNSLTSVTIPDSVTTIGAQAFYHCSSLTSVTIGDSVTTIGVGAFLDCKKITSITIPESVTMIEKYAFHQSAYIIYCKSVIPPVIDGHVFGEGTAYKIYVPACSVEVYMSADAWGYYYKDNIIGYNFE